ncbi:hypothetical protein BGU48_10770 [Clostridioides difficile]|uniref:hypothetical protein n=1 Tax=Clostridioides difficile TaxID=1496 RepID=UPI000BB1DA93|nr:hypothetical protein [Clostridioides difficile]MDV9794234.1 hypothetical protein [Clostridioides difficile]MDV9989361.1 hypothetical protein [Clostridioides difficile]PBF40835.1 hypothetical protein BGU48_10770 [Clostridioides difficile]HBF0217809.1 hypothetical protein [Clostridioides difficile]HBF0485205.1 hypothetical protein [Clostridioides difficile]
MNKQKARRFLRVIDMNMDKIEEEAIKAFKESCLIKEENDIKIFIDFQGKVEAIAIQAYTKLLDDNKEINIFTSRQIENNLDDMFGEICYVNDYEEFVNWCEDKCENLNWDSYKKFNKENFEEIAERNIDDSTPVFLEELREGIESCKQELQNIVEN